MHGVTSWGHSCDLDEAPGPVFAEVFTLLDFIKDAVVRQNCILISNPFQKFLISSVMVLVNCFASQHLECTLNPMANLLTSGVMEFVMTI